MTPSSKLFIRSEVLAVIEFLNTVESPPKQDKFKQLKRLQSIEDQDTVQRILVKELQRAAASRTILIVSELLMELGKIDIVQEPLWAIIQDPRSSDEVRDAANLVLRQLGDPSDPNLYLEYLDDPAGLINRETERMLEVSTRNPEALIDFIDFIFSLPVDEQGNLLKSLQADYPPEYLLNLFMPTLLALPPLETQELILNSLGEIRSIRSAAFLHQHQDWFEHDPRLHKAMKRSINALKIAGLYREGPLESHQAETTPPHPLVQQSQIFQCFATIPDGIGNQGLVISRKRPNGDVVMVSVAINDLHGIIDCFGFYELSKPDFFKLMEKFHEESTKIHAPPAYCLHKLQQAEALNHKSHFRIPYEYSCWKVILDDVAQVAEPLDLTALSLEWAHDKWDRASANLYHHPDFTTWFLEEGDQPVVTAVLEEVLSACARAMAKVPLGDSPSPALEKEFIEELDALADKLVRDLLATEWREILISRMADAAFLLHEQKAETLSGLAATEVRKLTAYRGQETSLEGFILHYGRRCIEEDLLRLKHSAQGELVLQNKEAFEHLVDGVLNAWEL